MTEETSPKKYSEKTGNNHNGFLKNFINRITTVMIVAIVLLALLLVGGRLIGLQVFTVLSGSMEPSYHVGSVIYVKEVAAEVLKSGDVITFMIDEDTAATHRIVEVIPDEGDPAVLRFRTKGDANASEDGGLVHFRNVIGSPVLSIPYLGYIANYIQSPPGIYVAISGGAVLLILVFLPDLFSDSEDEKKKKGRGKSETHPTKSE